MKADDVACWLAQHGLLDPASLVLGGVRIGSQSRRNQNFRVHAAGRQGYFVKHGSGADKARTIGHEARVYELLAASLNAGSALRIPTLHLYDPASSLLALDLFPTSRDLRAYHRAVGPTPLATQAAIGAALAALHQLAPTDAEFLASGGGSERAILAVDQPTPEAFRDLSAGEINVIGLIQAFPEFGERLAELGGSWRKDTIVHADLRFDNCLVGCGADDEVAFVDWEYAGLGDPRWDVGSVFADYLMAWISSIPASGDMSPERLVSLATLPLEPFQPCIRAFWESYATAMELGDGTTDWLVGCVRFAAARLLQLAIEQNHFTHSLSATTVCLLQLSLNVFVAPEENALVLLGIGEPHDA